MEERRKWLDLVFVLRAAKREKSEGDSQYEEEDEGEEEDETNYTSSREVEKIFAVKDHQSFWFF